MSCYNICLLCRFPTPYVCSSLAWQTEKWHKKNINSADRKHSTNLLNVMMMMVRTPMMLMMMMVMRLIVLTIKMTVVAMIVDVGPDADTFPCVSGLFLQMEYYYLSKWNISITPNGLLVFLKMEY